MYSKNKEKDKSFGVILVRRKEGDEDKFLILHQSRGHWGFPKGHSEKDETPLESAIRELKEETGITDIELIDLPKIVDKYSFELGGRYYDKTVEYFFAFAKADDVTIQEAEIQSYKWATYEEAMQTFNYEETKKVLAIAQKYLKDMLK
ncbi:MAG TPA: NUDIX domain-containing protein [Candidatus Paceibacterota bacterium]|nr:NUDIX domain-containing protein [Candidatus Paceibacterota bacterium]